MTPTKLYRYIKFLNEDDNHSSLEIAAYFGDKRGAVSSVMTRAMDRGYVTKMSNRFPAQWVATGLMPPKHVDRMGNKRVIEYVQSFANQWAYAPLVR